VTDSVAAQLLRLPMWIGLTEDDQQHVVTQLRAALR